MSDAPDPTPEESFMDRVSKTDPPPGWDELGPKAATGCGIIVLLFVLIMLSWLVKFIWIS